jgi:NAD(P)-dependent dehydrogenase (short-subunit alcohol dehydrogenase family)
MSERLDGQVTLVTGAASGIRKEIARRFCVVNNAGILGAVGSRADDLTAGYRRCLVGC